MYYNLEKAAEVLGITPGDLNRLREAGKMRAFRDGADWKFRKEDVNNYLTEQIKSRSQASAAQVPADESDLLNETEDELPTMLADSSSFESLLSANPDVVINSRDESENGLILDQSSESESANVLDGEESKEEEKLDQASDSGISLIDDDDIQIGGASGSSGSGISLVDDDFFEVGGSNVDLGQDNMIIGGSASGSELNLGGASGITLGSISSGGSGSGISLLSDDDNLFSLGQDATHQKFADAPQGAAKQAASPASEESEIFGLAEEAVDENDSTDIASEPLKLVTEEEDFQLAPIGTGDEDSDSESSSQVIALDDDNMFMTDDGEDDGGGVYGLEGGEQKQKAAEPAAVIDDLTADPFAAAPNAGAAPDSFGFGDDLALPDFSDAGGGFDLPDGGFGTGTGGAVPLPPDQPAGAASTDGFDAFGASGAGGFELPSIGGELPVTGGCSYAAGRGCMQESHYSGLSILLGLAPCILVLILAGIGAYELVRTIWSWDQPFGLTGTVLETIGGLINLI